MGYEVRIFAITLPYFGDFGDIAVACLDLKPMVRGKDRNGTRDERPTQKDMMSEERTWPIVI